MHTPELSNQPPIAREPRKPFNRHMSFWLIVLLLVVCCSYYFHHSSRQKAAKGKQTTPPPVVVATVKQADVPVYLTALGSITPTYNVTVKTQINGTLVQVLFKEGQMVKAGDLLAEIDNRPYLAALTQDQGQLLRDQAQLTNAQIDLKRYAVLWKQDSVSQQTLATQQALVKQLQGTVEVDQGLIQATKVNLAYCRIVSPVAGRVGLRLVDAGNFVQTSDTNGIAVVNTLDPITAIFTIAEDQIPAIREKIYAGQTFTVEAYNREQTKLLATGKLLTIDNEIDANTGTVKLKAEFPNPHYALFPSQFVNIKLLVKTLKNAIVVPTAALQFTATGTDVYILNPNNTVSMKPVTTGVANGNNTTINSGLTVGQSVVTEGADALTDGAKVTIATPKKTTVATTIERRQFA